MKIKKQSVLTKPLGYYKNTLYGRDDRIRTCEISRSQSERDTKLRHIPIFNFVVFSTSVGYYVVVAVFDGFFRKSHKPKIRSVKGVFEVLEKSPE